MNPQDIKNKKKSSFLNKYYIIRIASKCFQNL